MSTSATHNRNLYVDIMRCIFCIWIVLMHGESLYRDISLNKRIFEGGYLGVEFFFIVGGFYLLSDKNELNEIKKRGKILDVFNELKNFLVNRFRKLYPHFSLSILLVAAVGESHSLIKILCNELGLQLVFIDKYINGVLWFVVSEIAVCATLKFLNAFLKETVWEKAYYVVIALISVGVLIVVYKNYTSFDLVSWQLGSFSYGSHLRALWCISYGILMSKLFSIKRLSEFIEGKKIVFISLILGITIATLALQVRFPHKRFEVLWVLLWGLMVGISGCIEWHVFNFGFARYTYPVYVYQMVIISIWKREYSVFNCLVFLGATILFGVVMEWVLVLFKKSFE